MNDLEKKILWQCRRGLWELDAILIPFVERNFSNLEDKEIENLKKLLAYEDIEIFDILVNKKPFEDTEISEIVSRILEFQISNLGESF